MKDARMEEHGGECRQEVRVGGDEAILRECGLRRGHNVRGRKRQCVNNRKADNYVRRPSNVAVFVNRDDEQGDLETAPKREPCQYVAAPHVCKELL